MKRLLYIAIVAMNTQACEPKPKACLDWEDPTLELETATLEAGSTLTLESCSEDFDFLTWEFSDDRGYVSETVERQFEKEGDYTVTLTAYSNGAYRSDVLTIPFRTSFRYIDRFEIVGTSDFKSFVAGYQLNDWSAGGAEGTFTEDAPFIIPVWPESKTVLENTRNSLSLKGRKNGNTISLGSKQFNFTEFKDNPATFEAAGFTVKMYWRYRD